MNRLSYIGLHNHSEHSNYRLRDSINTIQGMFEYTRQLGHKGIAITEHETVGSSIEAIKTLEKAIVFDTKFILLAFNPSI